MLACSEQDAYYPYALIRYHDGARSRTRYKLGLTDLQ